MVRRVDRYIAATVARPMVMISTILILVFACFDLARTLTELEGHRLDAALVAQLVALKTLIALDVLLPLALYLAVVVGLAALQQHQETVALRSLGVSPLRTAGGVIITALCVAAIVAAAALFARPWAYQQVYALEETQTEGIGLAALAPDRFTSTDDRILYAKRRGEQAGELAGVMIYKRRAKRTELILAQRATSVASQGPASGLRLIDAMAYTLHRQGPNDSIRQLGELTIDAAATDSKSRRDRKAMSTQELLDTPDPEEVAERQWRLSRPLASVLLALAAIPLSSARPRSGTSTRLSLALGLFVVYFVLGDMARSWVEQGLVATLPGLWWPHAALAALLGLLALFSGIHKR